MRLIRSRRLAEEDGAVLMIMALSLPVIMLLLAMAMDFGNWYVHKRQLQTRADAAALAAGRRLRGELRRLHRHDDERGPRTAAEDKIRATALTVRRSCPRRYNTMPGDARTGSASRSTATPTGPCYAHPGGQGLLDGGGRRRAHVPSFFSGFGVPKPKIVASARVALRQPSGGMLPFVVADPSASGCVAAQFQRRRRRLVVATDSLDSRAVSGSATGAADLAAGEQPHDGSRSGSGARPTRSTYTNMAYVTSLPAGHGHRRASKGSELTPLNPGVHNDNPYFIPVRRRARAR